jgi:hypothetical protein
MSKKGGSGTTVYYGTIAVEVCRGPVYALDKILINSEVAWEGPIYRASSSNPVNLTTDNGTICWHWGTEDQPANPTLNKYAKHPPYRGIAYAVLVDYKLGQTTTAPNIEFICRAAPQQSIITGTAATESLDAARTANPIVAACDILTSDTNLGLPASWLNVASFQAVADAVQAAIPNAAFPQRSATAVSPLYDSQIEARAALAELTTWADAWVRYSPDGLIECGRWRADSTPPSVTTLSHSDLAKAPTGEPPDDAEIPNSYAVTFVDGDDLHKEAKTIVDDTAALADPNTVLRRQNLDAKFLITYDQAQRGGREALRRARAYGTWSCKVRRSKAVTPAGDGLRPGDYVRVPVSHPRASTQATRLLRITKVVIPADGTSALTIEGYFDPGAAPAYTVTESETTTTRGLVMPPINYSRVFALPPASADVAPALYALAARPHDLALGMNVYYDDTASGDFPLVGRQTAYALPVLLSADLTAAAGAVTFSLIGTTEAGVSRQRDRSMVTGWGGGLTEARNDELLLILVRKAADGSITPNGDRDWVEVLSIASAPALTAADTYSVDVLRGRLNTIALSHLGADTEGWIIYRSRLDPLSHADFDSMLLTGAPGYFRLGAYAARAAYDPAKAYDERTARDTASESLAEFAAQPDATTWVPQAAVAVPSGYVVETIIDGGGL